MKAEIIGEPVFAIELAEVHINVLVMCAAAHYDGKCKRAIMHGGFLYGIQNGYSFHMSMAPRLRAEAFTARFTMGDLDTAMKILEVAHSLFSTALGVTYANRLYAAMRMRSLFSVLFSNAQRLYHEWRQTITTGESEDAP